jgi:hypothetical protein
MEVLFLIFALAMCLPGMQQRRRPSWLEGWIVAFTGAAMAAESQRMARESRERQNEYTKQALAHTGIE